MAEPSTAPAVPLERMVIKELDLVAFTSSPAVKPEHRGKLLGLIGVSVLPVQMQELPPPVMSALAGLTCIPVADRAQELVQEGITSVILGPLHAQLPGQGPYGKAALNFFAPDASLSSSLTSASSAADLKMVGNFRECRFALLVE